MTSPDDIDPPQSGSGLFKATTQPSLDDVRALAIRTLRSPENASITAAEPEKLLKELAHARKTAAVLAAAFLDARRQIESAPGERVKKQLAVVLSLRRTIETGLDDDGNRVLLSPAWPEVMRQEERLLGKLVADEAAKEGARP